MKILTDEELKSYILRQFGFPQVNVRLTDKQIQQCIDAAKDNVKSHILIKYYAANEAMLLLGLIEKRLAKSSGAIISLYEKEKYRLLSKDLAYQKAK